MLAAEVHAVTGYQGDDLRTRRGGVLVRGAWRDALLLNLHSRLAQRVLVQLSYTNYRTEQDLYHAAKEVAWEIWFSPEGNHQGRSHGAAQPAQFAQLRCPQGERRRV